MSKAVEYGATGVQSIVRLVDLGTTRPALGVTVANKPNLGASWRRDFGNRTEFALADKAMGAPWEAGGFTEIYDGYYAVDTPDDAFVSPEMNDDARGVVVHVDDNLSTLLCIASYHPLQKTLEAPSFGISGPLYCSAQDLYDIFGKHNIYKWANIDQLAEDDPNYESYVQDRITKAIVYATADVNDKLRGGPYVIPFVDEDISATINQATAMKAGVWLYEWRGADDIDFENGEVSHRYLFMMHRADTCLEQIRQDARRLGVDTPSTRAPGAGN